jgi:23S rRNA (pseudouridine1915-N3)-methyltransferase
MKLHLISVGKTKESYLRDGEDEYLKRLQKFGSLDWAIIPDFKRHSGMSSTQLADKEGRAILERIQAGDTVILLDERGKQFSSLDLSGWMEQQLMQTPKRLVFVIGGPYGFSSEVYARADSKLSLSKLTFSHQMVRMIFLEQLYRAFTIIHNQPYHHE